VETIRSDDFGKLKTSKEAPDFFFPPANCGLACLATEDHMNILLFKALLTLQVSGVKWVQ
jgi:hypothetical protein